MKIEIHIPEIAELNVNIRQLIDTLNDLAVVGINAVKRAPAPVIEEAPATAPALVAEVEPEKPKRTRKAKAEEPAPEPVATEPDPQPEPESEHPAAVEPEVEASTHTLADCTALATPLQSAGKLDEAKAWLKEHGADRLKDLDPSHYGAFITFAKGLLG
jgi:hypothetical protein